MNEKESAMENSWEKEPVKREVRRLPRGVNELELAGAAQRQELPQWGGESAQEYAWFLYFCAHPHLNQEELAAELGTAQKNISRARVRFYWKARIGRWWAGRHEAPETKDWEGNQEELRREEWAMHQELLGAGREALRRWRDSDKVPTLVEITKVIDLASRLGRLASGLPLEHTEIKGNAEAPIRINIEAALERAYGSIIDVEVAPPV